MKDINKMSFKEIEQELMLSDEFCYSEYNENMLYEDRVVSMPIDKGFKAYVAGHFLAQHPVLCRRAPGDQRGLCARRHVRVGSQAAEVEQRTADMAVHARSTDDGDSGLSEEGERSVQSGFRTGMAYHRIEASVGQGILSSMRHWLAGVHPP